MCSWTVMVNWWVCRDYKELYLHKVKLERTLLHISQSRDTSSDCGVIRLKQQIELCILCIVVVGSNVPLWSYPLGLCVWRKEEDRALNLEAPQWLADVTQTPLLSINTWKICLGDWSNQSTVLVIPKSLVVYSVKGTLIYSTKMK